jgi:hypothetical protein
MRGWPVVTSIALVEWLRRHRSPAADLQKQLDGRTRELAETQKHLAEGAGAADGDQRDSWHRRIPRAEKMVREGWLVIRFIISTAAGSALRSQGKVGTSVRSDVR